MLPEFTTGGRSLALFRFLSASGAEGGWPTVLEAVAENVSGPVRWCSLGIANSGSAERVLAASPLVGRPTP